MAPNANKVEAAFLFDVVQNMQLSQGQVIATKHFHLPQPSAQRESTTDFLVIWKGVGFARIRDFMVRNAHCCKSCLGEGFWLFKKDHFASNI